jgi:hypothetical protein
MELLKDAANIKENFGTYLEGFKASPTTSVAPDSVDLTPSV